MNNFLAGSNGFLFFPRPSGQAQPCLNARNVTAWSAINAGKLFSSYQMCPFIDNRTELKLLFLRSFQDVQFMLETVLRTDSHEKHFLSHSRIDVLCSGCKKMNLFVRSRKFVTFFFRTRIFRNFRHLIQNFAFAPDSFRTRLLHWML